MFFMMIFVMFLVNGIATLPCYSKVNDNESAKQNAKGKTSAMQYRP